MNQKIPTRNDLRSSLKGIFQSTSIEDIDAAVDQIYLNFRGRIPKKLKDEALFNLELSTPFFAYVTGTTPSLVAVIKRDDHHEFRTKSSNLILRLFFDGKTEAIYVNADGTKDPFRPAPKLRSREEVVQVLLQNHYDPTL